MKGKLLLSAAPAFSEVDPYNSMVKRLKRLSFTGVCMGASRDWSDEDIRGYRKIFDDAGIRIDEVGAYCNLTHPDVKVRKQNIDDVRVAIEVADKLGGRNVGSVVGSPSNDFGNDLSAVTFSKETWRLVRDVLTTIASFTDGTSVRFLIEPYLLTCMNSPKAIRRMIDEVGHPNVGVVMDPVNMVTPDTYWRTGDLINECFDLLSDRIHLCHAKDIHCDPYEAIVYLKEVQPGQGVLDYKTFIKRIVGLDRPVPLMIEHIVADDQLIAARDYIVTQAKEVNVEVAQG